MGDRARSRRQAQLTRCHRGIRRLERRRRGSQRGHQSSRHRVAGQPARGHRSGGLLRLPGDPSGDGGSRRPDRAADLAHHQAGAGQAGRHDQGPGPGARDRAQHALALVQRRAGRGLHRAGRGTGGPARSAARGLAAHSPGSGQCRGIRHQAGHPAADGPGRLQGAHRDRGRAAACVRRGGHPVCLAVGGGAALRSPAAQPQGHARAVARRRGHPGRDAAAGRPAR